MDIIAIYSYHIDVYYILQLIHFTFQDPFDTSDSLRTPKKRKKIPQKPAVDDEPCLALNITASEHSGTSTPLDDEPCLALNITASEHSGSSTPLKCDVSQLLIVEI